MTTARKLEQLLFDAYPAKDAIPDDRIGLLVGDATAEVRGIALALDAKVANIEAAFAAGCNVLVSHHPVFWYPPTEFLRQGLSEGAAVYRAAELGVALIAMHTNLDCAPETKGLLLEPAGFTYSAPLSLPRETEAELRVAKKTADTSEERAKTPELTPSMGQMGVPKDGKPVSLQQVASLYKNAFGAVAKVWGSPEKVIGQLACCSGGGGSLVQRVINLGADCYVTGEVAYHEALTLADADVALIELGHDRSELPYREHLYKTLLAAGIDESLLHILGPTASWWQ
ncbi:MAG: Nif3-like dinuclear metal center hexameric protein [Coriobacteriales bacterium]|jgi:dinuclear metal center YbgI/SA1388 family protein|nr:Nif3-like dinuclear metal center hexameric protein [Coriobacteriales bacterium]